MHPPPEEDDYTCWKQALTGDSVDNIKGIPGIGPKKATAILMSDSTDDASWATAVIKAYEVYQEENEDTDVNLEDTLLQIRLLRNLKEYEEICSKYSLS